MNNRRALIEKRALAHTSVLPAPPTLAQAELVAAPAPAARPLSESRATLQPVGRALPHGMRTGKFDLKNDAKSIQLLKV